MVLFAGAYLLQGCMKSDGDQYDAFAVLEADIMTIQEYLDNNNIDAVLDSSTGVFYQIHSEGAGYRTLNGIEIYAQYQGQTLDGSAEFVNTFDGNPVRLTLGSAGDQSVSLHRGTKYWPVVYIRRRFGNDLCAFTIWFPESVLLWSPSK